MPRKRTVTVLGTGGAGLTAAIAAHDAGANVQLFEKADLVGGTTPWSGGMVWIPNNHLEAAAGVADSRDEAKRVRCHVARGWGSSRAVNRFGHFASWV